MIATLAVAASLATPITPDELVDLKLDGYERRRQAEEAHRRMVRIVRERRRISGLRERVLRSARGFLGTPYVWGGAGPGGVDCSGLVQYVYRSVGRVLPRTTWSQRYVGHEVALSQVQPGDLVFSYGYGHVAIYAGGGRVIVAPYTGAVVRYEPLWQLPINSIRRVIGA